MMMQKQKEIDLLEKEIQRTNKVMQNNFASSFSDEKCVQDLQEILQTEEKIQEY